MKRLLFVIAACLTLAACVYSQVGTRFDITKADQLTPGVSTEEDAKKLLGEPVSVNTNPQNNHQLLVWQYSYGTAVAVGGGAMLAIAFDENGTMIKVVQRTKV